MVRTKGQPAVACTCEVCGAGFMAKYAHVKKGTVRFCSRACHGAHKRTLTGQRANGYKGGPSGRFTCQHCGLPGVSVAIKRQKKFCSRECYDAAKSALLSGSANPMWRGGRYHCSSGYVLVHAPSHPRAVKGKVRQHILVAEQALGRYLPAGAVVHHVNEQKDDNRPQNLAILPSLSYHMALHARLRVLRAGGDPHRDQICSRCKVVKPRAAFYPNGPRPTRSSICAECARDYQRDLRERGRAA